VGRGVLRWQPVLGFFHCQGFSPYSRSPIICRNLSKLGFGTMKAEARRPPGSSRSVGHGLQKIRTHAILSCRKHFHPHVRTHATGFVSRGRSPITLLANVSETHRDARRPPEPNYETAIGR